MNIAFLNPQGNFDPNDSYWTQHPDFGGQLVYVKEIAIAMARQGHHVDIITRQIIDTAWPEFAEALSAYEGVDNVRIVRISCGPKHFLPKEQLWPYLGTEWVNGIIDFYQEDGGLPDFVTTHYGDGALAGVILRAKTGLPFTFTGHSLGAQKMDKLNASPDNLRALNERFLFNRRIMAERLGMKHAGRIITSTRQEQMEQYSHPAYQGAVDVNEPHGTRFAVIPPGVNRRIFSPDENELDAKISARLESALTRDIPANRRNLPLVICSSRLDRKKNHMALVRAFLDNEALRQKANLAIVVRGLADPLKQRHQLKGEEQIILNEIADLLTERNMWQVVSSFPLNSQLELAAGYRVAARHQSLFALTADYEPFGLAPLEAMSSGLPAVVTKNGGPAESMYDSDTGREYGVLVDPADPADVARGLLKGMADWRTYQEAGIERVVTRYTWERTAEGYLRVIQAVREGDTAPHADLAIPAYFTKPTAENDISLETLADLYFG